MTYVNQIELLGKGISQNKAFLEKIYNSGLEQARKWFDKIDCSTSFSRQKDAEMTLEKFLSLIDEKTLSIPLQINSPVPDEIRYAAVLYQSGVRKHAFIECPYNQCNLDIVSDAYKNAFGCELLEEPVQKGLVEYYKWRKKNFKI